VPTFSGYCSSHLIIIVIIVVIIVIIVITIVIIVRRRTKNSLSYDFVLALCPLVTSE
jgi:high-affinity Fe2+/Pb2+ permease